MRIFLETAATLAVSLGALAFSPWAVSATTQTLITFSPSAGGFGSAPGTTAVYFSSTPNVVVNNVGTFTPSSVNGDSFAITAPTYPALLTFRYNVNPDTTSTTDDVIAVNVPSTNPATVVPASLTCGTSSQKNKERAIPGFCIITGASTIRYFS